MAEPQAGQGQAGQSPRKILRIFVEDIPLSGPTDATSVLWSSAGSEKQFGWALTSARDGIVAEKDGRALLVPWQKVRLVEYVPAAVATGKAA